MSPEFPVVKYCPQAPEPGGCTPSPDPYNAAVVRVVSPWVCDLDVQGPNGTYRVTNAPAARELTHGCYTPTSGTAFPIGFVTVELDHAADDEEQEDPAR